MRAGAVHPLGQSVPCSLACITRLASGAAREGEADEARTVLAIEPGDLEPTGATTDRDH
ncbi:MAG: hypothetical protein WCJ30_28450 [Deltaproteobacteria bacterium]